MATSSASTIRIPPQPVLESVGSQPRQQGIGAVLRSFSPLAAISELLAPVNELLGISSKDDSYFVINSGAAVHCAFPMFAGVTA